MAQETVPEKIRDAIGKTVQYVIKHGHAFEQRLADDPNFAFVLAAHPHHHLYKTALLRATTPAAGPGPTPSPQTPDSTPTPLPPDLLFRSQLPAVSTLDLAIIKATAIAVASNDAGFVSRFVAMHPELTAQFEFSVESHSLFPLFSHYVAQYKLLLLYIQDKSDPAVCSRLDPNVLPRAQERARYLAHVKASTRRHRKQLQDDLRRYASIDWQSFSVVGMCEFDAIDEVKELPVPLSRDDILYRSLRSKANDESSAKSTSLKMETRNDVENSRNTATESTSKATDSTNSVTEPTIEPAVGAKPIRGMKVKAAGLLRLKPANPTKKNILIKCPISGELVPEHEFDAHLRRLLRDPRYQVQQQNYLKKNFSNASSLSAENVFENIQRLVKKRRVE